MVKKLTALLICALFVTGAVLADKDMTAAEETKPMKSETNGNGKKRGRYNRSKKAGVVYETDTVVSGGRYAGSSCSTGGCRTGKCGQASHMHNRCNEKERCGHCSVARIPQKPCCEKAVTVRAEPCLHKQVQYSWSCPATYAEAPCEVC